MWQSGSVILSYPIRDRYGFKGFMFRLFFILILQKMFALKAWLKGRLQKTMQPECPALVTPALGDLKCTLDRLLTEWKPKNIDQRKAQEIDPVRVRSESLPYL